jgi:hypothetical protein
MFCTIETGGMVADFEGTRQFFLFRIERRPLSVVLLASFPRFRTAAAAKLYRLTDNFCADI